MMINDTDDNYTDDGDDDTDNDTCVDSDDTQI